MHDSFARKFFLYDNSLEEFFKMYCTFDPHIR